MLKRIAVAVLMAVAVAGSVGAQQGFVYGGIGKSIDLGVLGVFGKDKYNRYDRTGGYAALGVGVIWDKDLVRERLDSPVYGELRNTIGLTLEAGVAMFDYRGVTLGAGGIMAVYFVCANTTYIGHDWCSSSGGNTPSSSGGRTYGTDEDTLFGLGGSLFVAFRKTLLGVTYMPLTGVQGRIGFSF